MEREKKRERVCVHEICTKRFKENEPPSGHLMINEQWLSFLYFTVLYRPSSMNTDCVCKYNYKNAILE